MSFQRHHEICTVHTITLSYNYSKSNIARVGKLLGCDKACMYTVYVFQNSPAMGEDHGTAE